MAEFRWPLCTFITALLAACCFAHITATHAEKEATAHANVDKARSLGTSFGDGWGHGVDQGCGTGGIGGHQGYGGDESHSGLGDTGWGSPLASGCEGVAGDDQGQGDTGPGNGSGCGYGTGDGRGTTYRCHPSDCPTCHAESFFLTKTMVHPGGKKNAAVAPGVEPESSNNWKQPFGEAAKNNAKTNN